MARVISVVLCVVLIAYGLSADVSASDAGLSTAPTSVATDAQGQAGLNATGSSQAIRKSKQKPVQGDVQSRGLLSKKKKKVVGGAAGHSDSSDQSGFPANSEPHVSR